MSIPSLVPGLVPTMLALAGVVLVVAGWQWWDRSVVALGFGAAAFMAGVLGAAGAPGLVQWLVLGVGGVGLTILFWRWNRLVTQGNTLPPGVGAVRLVGLQAEVRRDVGGPDLDPIGQVRVAGETWRAWTTDDHPIPAGAAVGIVAVKGTRLLVTAAVDTAVRGEPATQAGAEARPESQSESQSEHPSQT